MNDTALLSNLKQRIGGTKSLFGLFSCETKESCEIALALCILVVIFVILLLIFVFIIIYIIIKCRKKTQVNLPCMNLKDSSIQRYQSKHGIYDLQIDYNQTNPNEGFANKAFEASTNSFNLDLSQFIDLYDNNFIGIAANASKTMPKLAQKLIPDDVDRELRDVIEKRNVKDSLENQSNRLI